MSTKLPSKRDIRFTVAEDVRHEAAGRYSLLGVFPGERFAVGGPPPAQAQSAAFMIPSLAFVFTITGGEGKFSGRVRICAPDGKTILADSQIEGIDLATGRSSVLANASKPFVGPSFGTYAVTLEIGTARFKYPLIIEKAAESKPRARRNRASNAQR